MAQKNSFQNWFWLIPLVFVLLGSFKWLLPIVVLVALGAFVVKKVSEQSGMSGGRRIIDISSYSTNIVNSMRSKIGLVVGAVVLALLLFQSVVVIGAGSTGVVSLFGKVRDQEISSGIHLVNPLASVERMTIRTEEFSMAKTREGGEGDALSVLTKEGLEVTLDMTVLYRLQEDKASDVYKGFGVAYREKIIRPLIRSAIREVIADFEAKDIYSGRRAEVVQKLRDVLKGEFESRGISLEEVLLRDVALPERLTASIQEKLAAEQESQRYNFLLEQAKKEAERKRIEAAGQRDAQKIISESLTQNYLNYQYIQSLKDRQGTIYVPVNPSNGLPLFRGVGQ